MNLEDVQKMLRESNIEKVARATGLSRPTVMRVRDGGNFNYVSLEKIVKYFDILLQKK